MTGKIGADEPLYCDQCDRVVERSEAVRRETIGGLDPAKWQTLGCPTCGARLKTVFVGGDDR